MNYDPPTETVWRELSDRLKHAAGERGKEEDAPNFEIWGFYFFSLPVLDLDMRWKSEVKVECCAANDSESGSLLSNGEVSARLASAYVPLGVRCQRLNISGNCSAQLIQSGFWCVIIEPGLPL